MAEEKETGKNGRGLLLSELEGLHAAPGAPAPRRAPTYFGEVGFDFESDDDSQPYDNPYMAHTEFMDNPFLQEEEMPAAAPAPAATATKEEDETLVLKRAAAKIDAVSDILAGIPVGVAPAAGSDETDWNAKTVALSPVETAAVPPKRGKTEILDLGEMPLRRKPGAGGAAAQATEVYASAPLPDSHPAQAARGATPRTSDIDRLFTGGSVAGGGLDLPPGDTTGAAPAAYVQPQSLPPEEDFFGGDVLPDLPNFSNAATGHGPRLAEGDDFTDVLAKLSAAGNETAPGKLADDEDEELVLDGAWDLPPQVSGWTPPRRVQPQLPPEPELPAAELFGGAPPPPLMPRDERDEQKLRAAEDDSRVMFAGAPDKAATVLREEVQDEFVVPDVRDFGAGRALPTESQLIESAALGEKLEREMNLDDLLASARAAPDTVAPATDTVPPDVDAFLGGGKLPTAPSPVKPAEPDRKLGRDKGLADLLGAGPQDSVSLAAAALGGAPAGGKIDINDIMPETPTRPGGSEELRGMDTVAILAAGLEAEEGDTLNALLDAGLKAKTKDKEPGKAKAVDVDGLFDAASAPVKTQDLGRDFAVPRVGVPLEEGGLDGFMSSLEDKPAEPAPAPPQDGLRSRLKIGLAFAGRSLFESLDRKLDLRHDWWLYLDLAALAIASISGAVILSGILWG